MNTADLLTGYDLENLMIGVLGVWLLYRVIRGWLVLLDRKALPMT